MNTNTRSTGNPKAFKIPPPAAEGGRHDQLTAFARELAGAGVPRKQASEMLTAFQEEIPAAELRGIVDWAFRSQASEPQSSAKEAEPVQKKTALEMVQEKCASMTPVELTALSPVPIPSSEAEGLSLFLQTFYAGNEHINITTEYGNRDGDLFKMGPRGAGVTRLASEWIAHLGQAPVPNSKAGGWFRPNPVTVTGSGSGGAVKDCDVTSHRFMLVESDELPAEAMLGLVASVELPVAAVYTTGGSSRQLPDQGIHALIQVDAPDAAQYAQVVLKVLGILRPYGIDTANKNPSRMSRLPGAKREIGGVGDGIQRLLYINPQPTCSPIRS